MKTVLAICLACLLAGCGGGGDEEDTTGNMTIGKPDCSIPKSCV